MSVEVLEFGFDVNFLGVFSSTNLKGKRPDASIPYPVILCILDEEK